jgi:dTDP-glucose 4,6-dehydratase
MTATSNAIVEADLRAIAMRDLPWNQLSGLRVVVTGAGGFLGGYLVRTLLALHRLGRVARPPRVIALVRNVERARERFSDLAQDDQLEFMAWDLNSIAVPDLGDVHYVLHAASQASPRFYGTDPVGTLLPNTVGTAALLEALRRSADPKGFLFVSSSEVYGAVDGTAGLKEADYGVVSPTQIRACYAEGKRAGETTCVSFHHQYSIPIWIVRPFHTYGPGLTPEDGRVFSDFTYNVLRTEDIVMNSDGTARRAFCYASDAVAGFFAVLLRGEAGTAYNVANAGAEMSVMEFAELMVGLFPEKGLRIDRRVDTNSSNNMLRAYNRLVPDTARLESLGWAAEVTPAQGFKRMIAALQ